MALKRRAGGVKLPAFLVLVESGIVNVKVNVDVSFHWRLTTESHGR